MEGEARGDELGDRPGHHGIEVVTMQTCADVDDGASGYITMDKDFKPTGEPPPDSLDPISCFARSGSGRTATTF
jgi:hypothetical protein